jgi:hypothetical protein
VFDETIAVLRRMVGTRRAGVLLERRRFSSVERPLLADQDARQLQAESDRRCMDLERRYGRELTRVEVDRVSRGVWRDAGMVRCSRLRLEFMRITKRIGREEITTVTTWRHSLGTLLQDANTDPLIRQQFLGHAPTAGGHSGGLGMTAAYTHTRAGTYREQIRQALSLRPALHEVARVWLAGQEHGSKALTTKKGA